MKYEDLEKVNNEMLSTNIKGKDYVEVNQRIKAFRKLYPEGTIETEMLSNENGVCVFKAKVGYTKTYMDEEKGILADIYTLLGTGTAYEKENSTFINKTSYIENCETSAVGRALGMAGFGIDVSVASAEEVSNAINNQEPTIEDADKWTFPFGKYKDRTMKEILEVNNQYVKWYINNKSNDYDIKCYELLTGEKIPSEEETMQKIALMNKLNDLVIDLDIDYEELLNKYGFSSNNKMTIEQLNKIIEDLEKRTENE